MRRFIIIYKFAEGTPFRGCDSHKCEFEALGVLVLGVEFVDVELTTAGAEGHGFEGSGTLGTSKIKHEDSVVKEKRMGRGDVVEVVWHSRFCIYPRSTPPQLCATGVRDTPSKNIPARPEVALNKLEVLVRVNTTYCEG
jgi:hypothetical protein